MVLATFVVCAAISLLLLACGFFFRRQIASAATLGSTLALVASLIGALLSGLYLWDGKKIMEEGAGPMGTMLPLFEKRLAEGMEPYPSAKAFTVWVLGDSTHVSRGESTASMDSAMRDAAREKGIEDIRIAGFHFPGFNGYEYYFLLHKLLDHPPDLLVLPLNLRAFGPNWNRNGANMFPELERYCRWNEIPAAVRLTGADRRVAWPGILLRKLDGALFDSNGEAFLNGLKLRAEEALGLEVERPGAEAKFSEGLQQRTPEEQRAWIETVRKWGERTYEPSLEEDHPLIGVYHAIDRLASEHGIGVMYYTVQTPDRRARQDWNFTTLRWALGGDPGVRFITMTDLLRPENFAAGEHFDLLGMRNIASRLVDEMVLARDDESWRASLSRGGR